MQQLSTDNDASSEAVDDEPAEKASHLIETSAEPVVKLANGADQQATLTSATTFEALSLSPELLKGVYAMGYQKPSKIQATALPLLMHNPPRNFIGQSQSGTGKTAAFVLSLLSRVDPTRQATQAIVLAPTRELAHQILSVVKNMAQFTKITSTHALKDSVARGTSVTDHVIVGTPGTIQDLLRRRAIQPTHVNMFVIDEADVMLDRQGMGDQTIRVKQFLPKQCQIVLFSATYRDDVRQFAERVVPHADMISLKREELSVDAIKQLYLDCQQSNVDRYQILCDIYGLCNIGQSIIFVERRATADQISQRMKADGHQVTVIHGGLDPEERDRIFNSYRTGETKVLITTNVMARGIDVLDVNLVINYDLPTAHTANYDKHNPQPDYETYLHRIGRTGRFGRRGISINFVWDDRSRKLNELISAYFGRDIKRIGTEDVITLEKELKEALKAR